MSKNKINKNIITGICFILTSFLIILLFCSLSGFKRYAPVKARFISRTAYSESLERADVVYALNFVSRNISADDFSDMYFSD